MLSCHYLQHLQIQLAYLVSSNQLSVISYQLSVISYQLSAIGSEQLVITSDLQTPDLRLTTLGYYSIDHYPGEEYILWLDIHVRLR